MVECPKCLKITSYQRHCTQCGAIIIETPEDKFNKAADSLELLLKEELQKRRKKKRIKFAVSLISIILTLSLAIYIGIYLKQS